MKMKQTFFALIFICSLALPSALLAKPLTVAVLSDIHYAANAVDKGQKRLASSKKILPALLDKLEHDPKIDLIVFTGDMLVNPFLTDLKEFNALLAQHITKPYFVVPGNHDLPTWAQRKKQKSKLYQPKDFLQTYLGHPYLTNANKRFWSADFAGWHFIGLDTTQKLSWGGKLTQSELRWLKRDLANNREKPTLIFAHHGLTHFYSQYEGVDHRNFISNLSSFEKIIKNNPQVAGAVTGHMHMPIVEEKDGVAYFSAPTITGYPCRYAIMTLDDDQSSIKTFPVIFGKSLEEAKKGLLEGDWWHDLPLTADQLIGLYDRFQSYHGFGSAAE